MLSIIIPVYNEAESLRELHAEIDKTCTARQIERHVGDFFRNGLVLARGEIEVRSQRLVEIGNFGIERLAIAARGDFIRSGLRTQQDRRNIRLCHVQII